MNKKLLFIRGGFHKEFAYKSFIRMGYEMIMMDVADSKQLPLADYQYIINDIRNTEEIYKVAKKIYNEIGFDGIVTFMNSPVKAIGRLCDELGFDYFSEETGTILADKLLVRKKLAELPKGNVKYRKITSLEDAMTASEYLGYPFVMKPTDTASSEGVCIVKNKNQIQVAYKTAYESSFNKHLIAEEYIEGKEHCAEVIVVNGRPYIIDISMKIIDENSSSIELIDITPSPMYDEIYKEVEDYLSQVARQLAIRNWLLHIEFKIFENEIKIIEVNPRAAGGNLLESEWHLYGINIYELLYRVVLNERNEANKIISSKRKGNINYTAFYSYISPDAEGVVKHISGIDNVRDQMRPNERIQSYIRKGDAIHYPTSNDDFRGTMYLMGTDYHEVLKRLNKYEKMIEISVENE